MSLRIIFFAGALLLISGSAWAAPLSVGLAAAKSNPIAPQMGDRISFHSVIRNDATVPLDGLIAWISLVQVNEGREQPVDLEDWSAHKAVTAASLSPGATLETDWPVRLIQAGAYRVVVSAVTRGGADLTASPLVGFMVLQKPVVESRRVLPIAVGIPLLLLGLILSRRLRGR